MTVQFFSGFFSFCVCLCGNALLIFDFFLFGGFVYLLETMEDWDQETLEKVVESKKTEYNQNKPTEIVCLFKTLNSLLLSWY